MLALRAFWHILTDPDFAARVEPMFSRVPSGPDLRVLAVLQRDGRLVDFLEEDIDAYTDSQIGAAVRDIHRGCRKSLRDYLTIEPVINAAEEERVSVPTDFDPAARSGWSAAALRSSASVRITITSGPKASAARSASV